jgi:hypothetical protein
MRTATEYRERATQLHRDGDGAEDPGLRDLCHSLAGTFERLAIRAMEAEGRQSSRDAVARAPDAEGS